MFFHAELIKFDALRAILLLDFRSAAVADADLLARMNHRLIRDEGHRNPMTIGELRQRMSEWLAGEYEAVVFTRDGIDAGYALWRRESESIYLRQFYVEPAFRQQGVGRAAIAWLAAGPWKDALRIRLDVLTGNSAGIVFWRSLGFDEYCVTMERGV